MLTLDDKVSPIWSTDPSKTLPIDSEKPNKEDMITLVKNILSAPSHYFRYQILNTGQIRGTQVTFVGGGLPLFIITGK